MLNGRLNGWISVQTLSEFINSTLNKLKLPLDKVDGFLDFFDMQMRLRSGLALRMPKPEPTSGVGPTAYFGIAPQSLLLLGVAGMALRRHRA